MDIAVTFPAECGQCFTEEDALHYTAFWRLLDFIIAASQTSQTPCRPSLILWLQFKGFVGFNGERQSLNLNPEEQVSGSERMCEVEASNRIQMDKSENGFLVLHCPPWLNLKLWSLSDGCVWSNTNFLLPCVICQVQFHLSCLLSNKLLPELWLSHVPTWCESEALVGFQQTVTFILPPFPSWYYQDLLSS